MHPALPQTMTPENLAQWITDNAIEKLTHTEKTEHTEEYIAELEHKSSVASRALDQLKDVEKIFKNYLKNGTPVNEGLEGNEEAEHLPVTITIPPTKGSKVLTANREWADKLILAGFTGEDIEIFLIPFPEEKRVIAFNSEGEEYEGYSRDMTLAEVNAFGQLFAGEKEKSKKKRGGKNKVVPEAEQELEQPAQSEEPFI